jgi:acylphosphatase
VNADELRRVNATVFGRVQAVGFREFVRHQASKRAIAGYVRNSDDGQSVEVVAEGQIAMLEQLVAELHQGPRFARVDRVDVEYSDASRGFSRFSVEL